MPVHEIELALVRREFDDDSHLIEALLFPEVSRYGDAPELLTRIIARNAAQLLERTDLPQLAARAAPASTAAFAIVLRLEPPATQMAWRTAVDLRLDVVWWSHHDAAHIAFVPALGIEVVSTKLADLVPTGDASNKMPPLLGQHIRAELMRRRATINLKELLPLERTRAVSVTRASCAAEVRTPKQLAASAGQVAEKKKSTLEQTAVDLTKQKLDEAFEVDHAVARLAEALGGRAAKSVLLVGKAGVGKTAVVHELVRRRAQHGFGATPFWATGGARLVAGMSGFGMWQERCEALWREASEARAVIHFGNLVELMDTGKSEHNAQGLASLFRPRFVRGPALAVLECTPEQLPLVEREDPALVRAFHQLTIEEPTLEAGRRILTRYAVSSQSNTLAPGATRRERREQALLARAKKVEITTDGVAALDRLHRRYAGYSAYPGRPLRFLHNLLQHPATEHVSPLGASAVTNAFAKETGLPLFLLDDEVAFDGAGARRWFGERVIGQSAAVKLIIDLLATVKAGLTRARRPIASLLFIGPTGVGKTEMAKSLAKFFFADENRMARFDMSEYADALAVTRLVGSVTSSEGTLTMRIREQPFSVLLFDEFEKAHHSFFDLLLQILGEGRLTDGRGRVADFTNSIIVMTSNLGADRFRRARPGFRDELSEDEAARERAFAPRALAAQKHFTRAVQDFLRPEIFNRIDHIVPFLPLERDTMKSIAERELTLLQERDGVRLRGVVLQAEGEAVELLARRGYDARYGARPLKRLIERELLLPLAVELNRHTLTKKIHAATATLIAHVRVEANRLRVSVEERAIERRAAATATTYRGDQASLAARATRLSELRRRVQQLERSSSVIDLRNTVWRLTEIERRLARAARRAKTKLRAATKRHAWQRPEEASALARLPAYNLIVENLRHLGEGAAAAEDDALLTLYNRDGEVFLEPFAHEQLHTELRSLLRQLLDLRYAEPHRITLAIFSENRRCLFELARAYHATWLIAELEIKAAYFTPDVPPPELKELTRTAGNQSSKRAPGAATQTSTPEDLADDEQTKTRQMFGRQVARREAADFAKFLAVAPEAVGIVCELAGPSVHAAYESERGLHAFLEAKATHHLLVHTSDAHFAKYLPPPSLDAPEGLLTSAVRRTPFAVVLFDEIEKAHPAVFDLLLGVMGDARLTDARGRTVDFTNTIVILTSNLGVREAAGELGFRQTNESHASTYRQAAEKFFKPEFFNRLTRVVPFERLRREEVRGIARRLIEDVFHRDGLVRRGVKLLGQCFARRRRGRGQNGGARRCRAHGRA